MDLAPKAAHREGRIYYVISVITCTTTTHMGMIIPLLLTLLFSSFVSGASQCPKLPDRCSCDSSSKLSIFCNGVDPNRIVKLVNGLTLDRLQFENCSLPVLDAIPKANIRSLKVSNCKISSVSDKAFLQIRDNLEELDLSFNDIVTIPLFGKMPKLAALNLNSNKVKSVPEGVFDGLLNIRQLRLESNDVCELESNAFNETKRTLELLDLSGNCFSSIPAQNLRNSVKLMYLDLSDNKISEVANFQLMNLPVLKELRLNDNLLSKIDPMAFMNVPQLQQLSMRNNLISDLDGNRLQAFKELEILDVSNNLLGKVPTIKELVSLKQVRLDGNQITKIETLAFSNNPKLQLISLHDNNIDLISRNSFDSLDQLIILVLANNSIKTIDRGMLDGMRNLQQLNLKNNSIMEVDSTAFSSVKMLTSLDLSNNQIQRVAKGAFADLPKLFWLDLSNNKLSTFEKGSFDKKIANILLDGNQLSCGESMDWFINFLVTNRVRTFLPLQPEITCSSPEKYSGVRLKDLMMKKANETLNSLPFNDKGAQKSLLTSFIPGLNAMGNPNAASAAAAMPFINGLTQAMPSLRSLPGMNYPPGGVGVPQNRDIGSALDQFTAPLVRFATGGVPVASDIEQLLTSIPNLVVNVPGIGNVDISKLDPSIVAHVLKGGQIPGIPKESLDAVVKQYMSKMAEAAQASKAGKSLPEHTRFLPPLEKLPAELVTSVISGENLPHLDQAQTKAIQDYYTQAIPVSSSAADVAFPTGSSSSMSMMQLLPPGYNISKLPAEVIQAAARGEIPDMKLLPEDLQQYLKMNSEKVMDAFAKQAHNISLEMLLSKIPNFQRPELETFEPYDLNKISNDMMQEEEEIKQAEKLRLFTAIALGLVGALSCVILGVLYMHIKRKGNADHTSLVQQRNDNPSPNRITSTQIHRPDN